MTNLYAILPAYAPGPEVRLVLADTDEQAMEHGVYTAAKDVADANYCSPYAEVYLVARNITKVGDAQASDAPKEWLWAHPAVDVKRCPRCNDPIEDHADPAGGCDIWARGADGEVLTVD